MGYYTMADEFVSETQNFSSNNLPIFQNFEKYEKKQEGSTLYRMDTSIVFIFDRQTLMRIMEYSKAGKKVAPNLRIQYLFTSFISQQNKNLLTYYTTGKKSPFGL